MKPFAAPNPVLEEKWRKKQDAEHAARLAAMKPVVDTEMPETMKWVLNGRNSDYTGRNPSTSRRPSQSGTIRSVCSSYDGASPRSSYAGPADSPRSSAGSLPRSSWASGTTERSSHPSVLENLPWIGGNGATGFGPTLAEKHKCSIQHNSLGGAATASATSIQCKIRKRLNDF